MSIISGMQSFLTALIWFAFSLLGPVVFLAIQSFVIMVETAMSWNESRYPLQVIQRDPLSFDCLRTIIALFSLIIMIIAIITHGEGSGFKPLQQNDPMRFGMNAENGSWAQCPHRETP